MQFSYHCFVNVFRSYVSLSSTCVFDLTYHCFLLEVYLRSCLSVLRRDAFVTISNIVFRSSDMFRSFAHCFLDALFALTYHCFSQMHVSFKCEIASRMRFSLPHFIFLKYVFTFSRIIVSNVRLRSYVSLFLRCVICVLALTYHHGFFNTFYPLT